MLNFQVVTASFKGSDVFQGGFRYKVVAITQKINAEKLLNVVVADQLKDQQKHMENCHTVDG